jgi:tetratricopeptide (TPR) repeat protein
LGLRGEGQVALLNRLKLEENDLRLHREVGDTWGVAMQLSGQGVDATQRRDYNRARALFQEALALLRQLGDRFALALTLWRYGEAMQCQGQHLEARRLILESLDLSRELGAKSVVGRALRGLAGVAIEKGDHQAAGCYLEDSLTICQGLGMQGDTAIALKTYARLAASQREPERALRLAGAAVAWQESYSAFLLPDDQIRFEQALDYARQALNEETASMAWVEGQAMSLEEAVEYALMERQG